MKLREVRRKGKPVWEADLPPTPKHLKKRGLAATKAQAIVKAQTSENSITLNSTFGDLPGVVYAMAARWSVDGRLGAEEIAQREQSLHCSARVLALAPARLRE